MNIPINISVTCPICNLTRDIALSEFDDGLFTTVWCDPSVGGCNKEFIIRIKLSWDVLYHRIAPDFPNTETYTVAKDALLKYYFSVVKNALSNGKVLGIPDFIRGCKLIVFGILDTQLKIIAWVNANATLR